MGDFQICISVPLNLLRIFREHLNFYQYSSADNQVADARKYVKNGNAAQF